MPVPGGKESAPSQGRHYAFAGESPRLGRPGMDAQSDVDGTGVLEVAQTPDVGIRCVQRHNSFHGFPTGATAEVGKLSPGYERIATTGAWSDGLSSLRGALSMTQPEQRCASPLESSTRSMRSPRLRRNASSR